MLVFHTLTCLSALPTYCSRRTCIQYYRPTPPIPIRSVRHPEIVLVIIVTVSISIFVYVKFLRVRVTVNVVKYAEIVRVVVVVKNTAQVYPMQKGRANV